MKRSRRTDELLIERALAMYGPLTPAATSWATRHLDIPPRRLLAATVALIVAGRIELAHDEHGDFCLIPTTEDR